MTLHFSTLSSSLPDQHLSWAFSNTKNFGGGTWKRPPGRLRSKWLDQIRSDNNFPLADLWRCAVRRGHSGVTERCQLTV